MQTTTPEAIHERVKDLEAKTAAMLSATEPDPARLAALKEEAQGLLEDYTPLLTPSSKLQ